MDNPEERSNLINDNLSNLSRKEEELISTGKQMLSEGNLYLFDLLCTAVLNRSLNLVRGFISLMNEHNFIAAAPLIRIHLDSLLRLYAFSLVDENIDELTFRIIKGESIRVFKSREGASLTDKFLVESISKETEYIWIKSLYNKLSGFIHLSDMHILSCSTIKKTESIICGTITRTDEFIPENDKVASITFMIMITDGIISFIKEWIDKKMSYREVN